MFSRPDVYRFGFLLVIMGIMLIPVVGNSVAAARDNESASEEFRNIFESTGEDDLFEFGPVKSLFPELEDGNAGLEEFEEAARNSRRKARDAAKKRMEDRRKDTSDQEEEPGQSDLSEPPLDVKGSEDGTLSWDQADLLVVLKGISEITGMNFIISPQVRTSNITILTAKEILNKDLPEILQSILEVNGLASIKSGDYYKIVPQAESINYNMETGFGGELATIPEDDRMITQVLPITNLSVTDVSSIVTPLLSKSGKLLTHEGTNTLIICSTASNIRRMLKIIEKLDVPGFSSDEQLFVYYVENGEAANIANTLNTLFSEEDNQLFAARRRAALSRRKREAEESPAAIQSAFSDFTSSLVVADESINAIIIKATPSQYDVLKRTITKLDIPPKQVLIEVLIAEVTLDDQTEFGIEWELGTTNRVDIGGRQHSLDQSASNNLGFGVAGADSVVSMLGGLNFLISESNRFKAFLNAKASESLLNVLASPHIVATDNEEASISITDEVPVEQRDISESGNIFVSYAYRDAGIKLSVTPHINEKGMIALELEQEVSEISSPPSTSSQPTFRRREAKTTVRIFDNQTLVIGGLFEETTTSGRTGIPILSEIPIIGFLFSSNSELTRKTELVIMLTPHLIDTYEKGNLITEKVKEKMESSFDSDRADMLGLGDFEMDEVIVEEGVISFAAEEDVSENSDAASASTVEEEGSDNLNTEDDSTVEEEGSENPDIRSDSEGQEGELPVPAPDETVIENIPTGVQAE